MKKSTHKISRIELRLAVLLAGIIIASTHCIAQSAVGIPPRTQSAAIMQAAEASGVTDGIPGEIINTQRNDLSGENLVRWEKYGIASDTSFRVFFLSGTDSCYGYRAMMEETPKEIRVAVISGLIPNHAPACILIAGRSHFLLKTKNPIAGRKIIQLEHVELNP